MKCLNKNSLEYQNLLLVSGIPTKILDLLCSKFLEEHNRLPRLDELQGSNSSSYITSELKVNKKGYTGVNNLLEFTGTNSVEEAVININNLYLDLLIEAFQVGDKVFIETNQRPNTKYKELEEEFEPDSDISPIVLIKGLDDLRTLYGYNIKEITNSDLETEEWSNLMPSDKIVNAFIYNGNIYINTDKNSPDSKIHEMLHLLIGAIRFTNPNLYQELLSKAMQIDNIENLLTIKYPLKTQNDALEELFVSELAKYLSGLDSKLNDLSKEQIYEINYTVKRTLDTLLNGDYSTKIIPDNMLYNLSYKEVAKLVNSSKLTSNFYGFSIPKIHRELANIKSELLKKGELNQIC